MDTDESADTSLERGTPKGKHSFDSTSAREAGRRSAQVRREKRDKAQALTDALQRIEQGEEGEDGVDRLALAGSVLATIAADTAAPHASRVAAARALQERAPVHGDDRTLAPDVAARLLAWVGGRVEPELREESVPQLGLWGDT